MFDLCFCGDCTKLDSLVASPLPRQNMKLFIGRNRFLFSFDFQDLQFSSKNINPGGEEHFIRS